MKISFGALSEYCLKGIKKRIQKVKKYCNCEDYFTRLKGIYEELLEV